VSHEKFPQTSPPALPYFYSDFRLHSHHKRSGFKTEQYIEILKNAQDVQMIGLNSGQDISPIHLPIFTGGQKQIWLNFTLLEALVSKWSNR